LTEKPLF